MVRVWRRGVAPPIRQRPVFLPAVPAHDDVRIETLEQACRPYARGVVTDLVASLATQGTDVAVRIG